VIGFINERRSSKFFGDSSSKISIFAPAQNKLAGSLTAVE